MTENRETRNWYRLSPQESLDRVGGRAAGLSRQEAAARLERHGRNTIRSDEQISAWRVLLDQFMSPLIYVLIAALAVTLAIQSWGDAIVIAAVLAVNATVGFIQEYRAETAVHSLMEMVSPRATVRREDRVRPIDSEELVPGDIAVLSEGDMVPADIRLLDSSSLQVNESALTGESVPTGKTEEPMADADENLPPVEQRNMAFMGTAVTAGHAEGVVVGTGARTELGKIAEGVREAGEIETPLQRRMDRLAKRIAAVILFVAAIAFGAGLLMGNAVVDMFLLAVSLSVAAIPAGLPVVMTVALAIGVRRMARRNAVIRNLPAVETLGSTMTIVSDKTGTLTQNRMTVQTIVAGDGRFDVTGKTSSAEGQITSRGSSVEIERGTPLFFTLLSGLLNNSASIEKTVSIDGHEKAEPGEEMQREENEEDRDAGSAPPEDAPPFQGDPMEVALLVSAAKGGLWKGDLLEDYPRIDEVPFKTERRFSASVHEVPDGEEGPLVLVKGAPEVIFEMCERRGTDSGGTIPLDRDEFNQQNAEMANRGLRVLAMAIGRGREAHDSIQREEPRGMTFVGMQGLLDPPRREAIDAVDRCHEAGIRVIMVTGDHSGTATAIARQVHLARAHSGSERDSRRSPSGPGGSDRAEEILEAGTGREIAAVSDEELDDVLSGTNVFARVKPEQKLRIVERLKAQRQVVAVTGDGVNDAPALKAAHLGAAMGRSGTDVAKEASDMVITDDNFASIYSAVEEGRTAFRNIGMATFFLLSTGAAVVLIILAALGMGWPLPLLPAQILWCNVVTNGIADVVLGFEPGERALYRRPPRPTGEGVLDAALIERLIWIGIWLAVGTLGVFYWIYFHGDDSLALARVAALTTLVLFQKIHVFNCRSEDVSIFKKSLFANKVLLAGVLTSLAVHVAALYIPWTQELLEFQPLPWYVWIATIGVASTAIIVNEVHKWLRPRDMVNRPESWISRLTSLGKHLGWSRAQ